MEISNLPISSFDRMFPNQDTLPKGGYGNLIALPFQNEPSKYGNTIFIDRNFMKEENQLEYLKSIHKLTEREVLETIEKLSNETIDIGHEIVNMNKKVLTKSKNKINYPKSIKVILNDMVYIDANKREYPEYYDLVFPLVRPGGYILADNVLWDGKVYEDNVPGDRQTTGIARFNDIVAADPRVESVIIPVRDGLNLIRKRDSLK